MAPSALVSRTIHDCHRNSFSNPITNRTMMDQNSLAERLGYLACDRLLIINCDDLGVSHAANVATSRGDG